LFGPVQLQAVEISVAVRQLLRQARSLASDTVMEQMRRQAIRTLHIHAQMNQIWQHAHANLMWQSQHGYDMQSITHMNPMCHVMHTCHVFTMLVVSGEQCPVGPGDAALQDARLEPFADVAEFTFAGEAIAVSWSAGTTGDIIFAAGKE
jgi:hypothetical protein